MLRAAIELIKTLVGIRTLICEASIQVANRARVGGGVRGTKDGIDARLTG